MYKQTTKRLKCNNEKKRLRDRISKFLMNPYVVRLLLDNLPAAIEKGETFLKWVKSVVQDMF